NSSPRCSRGGVRRPTRSTYTRVRRQSHSRTFTLSPV
ncbi:hypothetical protein LINPERHAP2_LOCUS35009, partial [Linum perenne]